MQIKLRKYQDILTTAGTGVLVFAVWSVIKSFLVLFLEDGGLGALTDGNEITPGDILVIVLTFVIIAIDLALRSFVGLSARADAKGKKKGRFYVVVACFLLFLEFLFTIAVIKSFVDSTESFINLLVALFFELATIFALTEVIVSSITIKRIRKKQTV